MIPHGQTGGDSYVRRVVSADRALLAPLSAYQFQRGDTVDVAVVLRLYDKDGVKVGSYTYTVSSSPVGVAAICGGAIPAAAVYGELDHVSTGAATTLRFETGTIDAYSKTVATNASGGALQTILIGRYPLA